MSISIDDLSGQIVAAVSDYTEEVTAAIEKEIDRTSRAFLKDTKALAPQSKGVGGGKYKNGFRIVKSNSYGVIKRTMWNPKYPGLVHLLENGHAIANGTDRAPGKPHIRPAYAKNVEGLPDRIKAIIRNGG